MHSILTVTEATESKRLVSLDQVKSDLGLGDDNDGYYERLIDIASDEISVYIGRRADEEGNVTIGLESLTETFYQIGCVKELLLGRFPIAEIISVTENGATTPRQLSGSDGEITATDATFSSAIGHTGGAFTSDHVGKSITIKGAGADGAELVTTIASVTNEATVELSVAASTTVSSANYTLGVDNPSFSYVAKKATGTLLKLCGSTVTSFTGQTVSVDYRGGWVLPDAEEGRNLPPAIEEACILLVQYKLGQFEENADVMEMLKSVQIEGVGNFQFADSSYIKSGSLPYNVRSILDKYVLPTIA